MRFFKKMPDGGANSGVTGYWLIEWKSVFSIVLLRFSPNNRENFHSHAFNALTWWLSGEAIEELLDGTKLRWTPSLFPKYTPRSNSHKIHVNRPVWALSLRGPWNKTWTETTPDNRTITLTNGRKRVEGDHV